MNAHPRFGKTVITHSVLITFVFLCFQLSARAADLQTLTTDDNSDQKFQSVIFGRLHITSKAGSLHSTLGNCGEVVFMRKRTKGAGASLVGILVNLKPWQSSYDKEIDIPFYAEAVPGSFDLRSVSFIDSCGKSFDWTVRTKFVAGIAQFNSNFENSKFVHSVPEGKLVYIGTIEIEIIDTKYESTHEVDFLTKETITGITTVNYSTRLTNQLDKELAEFQTRYPKLYQKYKDNVVTAFWPK